MEKVFCGKNERAETNVEFLTPNVAYQRHALQGFPGNFKSAFSDSSKPREFSPGCASIKVKFASI